MSESLLLYFKTAKKPFEIPRLQVNKDGQTVIFPLSQTCALRIRVIMENFCKNLIFNMFESSKNIKDAAFHIRAICNLPNVPFDDIQTWIDSEKEEECFLKI